jgi:hypothetical protein
VTNVSLEKKKKKLIVFLATQTSSIDLMTNVDVKESLKNTTTETTTGENEFLDDTSQ